MAWFSWHLFNLEIRKGCNSEIRKGCNLSAIYRLMLSLQIILAKFSLTNVVIFKIIKVNMNMLNFSRRSKWKPTIPLHPHPQCILLPQRILGVTIESFHYNKFSGESLTQSWPYSKASPKTKKLFDQKKEQKT